MLSSFFLYMFTEHPSKALKQEETAVQCFGHEETISHYSLAVFRITGEVAVGVSDETKWLERVKPLVVFLSDYVLIVYETKMH